MLVVPAMTASVQDSIVGGIELLMSLMSTAGIFVFCLGVVMFLYTVARERTEASRRATADGSVAVSQESVFRGSVAREGRDASGCGNGTPGTAGP
jgi:hypothetical protein